MLFDIYNSRMQRVDWVDAVDKADALKHAKQKYPGCAVEQRLTRQQQQQKQYDESVEMWEAMNPRYAR